MTNSIVLPGLSVDQGLQAIAIGYTPGTDDAEDLIQSIALPEIDLGGKKEYEYRKYDITSGYTVPDTDVSRSGSVRRVDFPYQLIKSITKDYGLEDAIPKGEYESSNGMSAGSIGEQLMRLVKLDREQRVAGLVFNPNSYLPAQTVTLSGSSQFNNQTTSQPIQVLSTAMQNMIAEANTIIFGRESWTSFSTHPQIVASYQARTGITLSPQAGGVIPPEYLKVLFPNIKKVGIGRAFINAGNPSTRGSLALKRVWGKHIALLRNEPVQLPVSRTFGFTAYTRPVTGTFFDPKAGLEGSYIIRMGEMLEEVISEPAFGYFIQNVTS